MDSKLNISKIARPLVAVFAVGALAVALGACSSGGTTEETPADEASAASVSPPVIMNEGELNICANFDSPPNIFLDEETGEHTGVEYEIALGLAEQMGLTAKFNEMSWGGMLPALQAQQCDTIVSTLYVSEERKEVANFVPYLGAASGIMVSAENPKGVTGYDESLCGVRLLTITGTDPKYKDFIQDLCAEKGLPQMEVSAASSSALGLQQVLSDQVDVFMETYSLAGYYAKTSDGKIQVVGEPSNPNLIGAATLKSNTELNDAIQAALDEMIADGSYGAILAEWGQEALGVDVFDIESIEAGATAS